MQGSSVTLGSGTGRYDL